MKGVEGVEELLLRLHLALQELNVIDEQHVDVAVAALKVGRLVVADRVDEVVGELFGVHVSHLDVRIQAARVVADGVQQVGLAQARVAIDEQGVVGLGRGFGDRDGGGVRKAIARADDEGVEGVLAIESGHLHQLRHDRSPGLPRSGIRNHGERRSGGRLDDRHSGSVLDQVIFGGIDPIDGGTSLREGGLGLVQGRIDGDRDAHLTAQAISEGRGDQLADLGLEDVLGVVIGNRDQRGVIEDPVEASLIEESTLRPGERVAERLQCGGPHRAHVEIRHLSPSSSPCVRPTLCRNAHQSSTYLSTGVGM